MKLHTKIKSTSNWLAGIFLYVGLISTFSTNGQISASTSSLKFGEITKGSNRIQEFKILNSGDADCKLLTANFPRDYSVEWESKDVKAGGEVSVRVKLNPWSKGKITDKVELFFTCSLKPIQLNLSADVKELDPASNTPCPKFGPNENCCDDWLFTLVMKDKNTLEPIHKGLIEIAQNGRIQRSVTTRRDGKYEEEVPIGFYYLMASAEGYLPADSATYINRRNTYVELLLDPIAEAKAPEIMAEIPEIEREPIIEKVEEIEEEIDVILEEVVQEEPVEESSPEPVMDTSSELPESRYKANNLVFLVDVSQSMNQSGKLEILKSSMYRLTEALRSTDKVTVIAYAREAEVLLDGVPGSETAEIDQTIAGLTAGGMTSGGIGFRTAYASLREAWIENGNNQVIVVTDGAFRKADHESILKMARKQGNKGATTSVVAIKSTDYARKVLSEVVDFSEGHLLQLDDFRGDREKILDEIKKQSLISK